jgi:hypothetical protein
MCMMENPTRREGLSRLPEWVKNTRTHGLNSTSAISHSQMLEEFRIGYTPWTDFRRRPRPLATPSAGDGDKAMGLPIGPAAGDRHAILRETCPKNSKNFTVLLLEIFTCILGPISKEILYSQEYPDATLDRRETPSK